MIEEEGNSSDEERPSTSVVVDRGSRQYGEPKHVLHRQAVRSRIAEREGSKKSRFLSWGGFRDIEKYQNLKN